MTTALRRIAEHWIVRHRPLDDEQYLLYWGTRAQRDGVLRNELSLRPALEQPRVQWQLGVPPSNGFFMVADMRTPRRRATYSPTLQRAYAAAVSAIITAV